MKFASLVVNNNVFVWWTQSPLDRPSKKNIIVVPSEDGPFKFYLCSSNPTVVRLISFECAYKTLFNQNRKQLFLHYGTPGKASPSATIQYTNNFTTVSNMDELREA